MNTKIDRYLHETIYGWLEAHNEDYPDFRFRLRRSNRYERLSKGFWFHGNENYLALSFWSGSDWKNKTPNISFIFNDKGEVYLELSAKDSDIKTFFFIDQFYKSGKTGFIMKGDASFDEIKGEEGDDLGVNFSKKLDYEWRLANIHDILNKIISKEKRDIDQKLEKWLKKNPKQGANPLRFINSDEFDRLKVYVEKFRDKLIEEDLTENPFSVTTQTIIYNSTVEERENREKRLKQLLDDMDISIQNIQIKKYKELENITIEKIPKNKQWIFITGENGNGKSSLLEALVLGMNGRKDENLNLFDDELNIDLEVMYWGRLIKNELNTKKASPFEKVNEFACYGPNRFDISSTPSTSGINLSGKTYNLFNGNGKLLNIEEELVKWDLKSKLYLSGQMIEEQSNEVNPYSEFENYFNLYQQIKEIFIGKGEEGNNFNEGLLPSVVEMEPDIELDDDKIYYRIGKNNLTKKKIKDQEKKLFSQLSTGNKSLIAMVGDIILRFFYFEKNSFVEYPDPTNFSGIVFIDEIDAHIHPKWQMTLPKILSEIFPRVQFIATCHSPIPLMGVPDKERACFIKMYRDDNYKIKAEKLDYVDIYDLTPEAILTSPIFDFKALYKTSDKNLRFSSSKDYNEVVFERILDAKLKEKAYEIKKRRDEEN